MLSFVLQLKYIKHIVRGGNIIYKFINRIIAKLKFSNACETKINKNDIKRL